MAFLDDIFGKSDPDRSAAVFTAIQEELLRVGIRSNRMAWRCVPSSTARGDGIGHSHGTA